MIESRNSSQHLLLFVGLYLRDHIPMSELNLPHKTTKHVSLTFLDLLTRDISSLHGLLSLCSFAIRTTIINFQFPLATTSVI